MGDVGEEDFVAWDCVWGRGGGVFRIFEGWFGLVRWGCLGG